MATTVHKLQGAGGVGGADSYWIALIGTSGSDATSSLAIDNDDNILFGGSAGGTPKNSFLVKVSPSGSVIWAKTSEISSGLLISDVNVSPNNDIIACGNMNQTAYDSDCFVVKYDTDGAVVWMKEIEFGAIGQYFSLGSICSDSSNNIYYAGSMKRQYDSTLNNSYVFFFGSLDSSGNDRFQRWWGTASGTDYASGCFYDETTGYLNMVGVANFSTYSWQGHVSANSSGVQRLGFWGSSYSAAYDITKLLDGNLLSVGHINSGGSILKSAASGPMSVLFDKRVLVNSSWSLYLTGCAEDSLGNIYVCGYESQAYPFGVVIKLNSSGVIIWSKKIAGGASTKVYLQKIKIDSNDNVVVSGYTDADGAGGYDSVVIRLPNDGSGEGTYGGIQISDITSVTESLPSYNTTFEYASSYDSTTDGSIASLSFTEGDWTYTEELLPITI